jgi:hypothetical protein
MTPSAPPLDVAATLEGKRILFIGGTGFVGKVDDVDAALQVSDSWVRLFALVRPGSGFTAETRFFQEDCQVAAL